MTKKVLPDGRYGSWEVIREVENKPRRTFLCRCLCGFEKEVLLENLRGGISKSCGSIKRGCRKSPTTSHGKAHTSEYKAWIRCKNRCYNSKFIDYKYYGGKGVIVCDRWLNSFENFLEDMGEKPSKDYSLDRIDPNGNYEPLNCRWTTKTEQAFNQGISIDNTSGFVGVYEKPYGYVASISFENTQHYLGFFTVKEEAMRAREAAELKYYGYLKHGSYFDKETCL